MEKELLVSGIRQMVLEVSDEAQEKLLQYLTLLKKWNKVYNLTAIRDGEEMVKLHLLDSLSVLPYVGDEDLLDVGSGGGLPGIVLAIVKPHLKVTTIDTVQKKAIFMRQVKGELGLDNLEVVHARVEAYQPEQPYKQVVSRAFSDIGKFVALTKHLLAEQGKWLAMKGVLPEDEMGDVLGVHYHVETLNVAYLEAERHLIVIENKK